MRDHYTPKENNVTNTNYLADLVLEELAQATYLAEEARREIQQDRSSEEVYACYHNGQVEGVY